jgi:hypothetical protein
LIWQKLNLIYLLIFGYNILSDNPFIKKLNKITFWLLLPTIIILSVLELGDYKKGDISIYTSETHNKYVTVTFQFNRKLYRASSNKITEETTDSCYIIYKENAYGLRLSKKIVFVQGNIKDSVKVKLLTKQFFPVDF